MTNTAKFVCQECATARKSQKVLKSRLQKGCASCLKVAGHFLVLQPVAMATFKIKCVSSTFPSSMVNVSHWQHPLTPLAHIGRSILLCHKMSRIKGTQEQLKRCSPSRLACTSTFCERIGLDKQTRSSSGPTNTSLYNDISLLPPSESFINT